MASNRLLSLVLAAFLVLSGPAQAQNPPVTTTPTASNNASSTNSSVSDPVCDSEVFERMKQKAWMEAQRENYVNQTIITAPDSIFDNTCYKKQLGVTMDKLGLEESSGSSSSKDKFETDVADNANIVNEFVGPITSGTSGSKDTSKPTASSDFKCAEMSKYWAKSQCGNFAGGNLPSISEAGASGTAKESRKYVDENGQEKSCTGKDDTTDTTGLFNFTTAQENTMGTADAPGPKLTNYSKVDPELCKRLPYSQIPQECPGQGAGNKCAPGKKLNVPWPQNTKIMTIECPNPGCSAQEEGGQLVCKQTK